MYPIEICEAFELQAIADSKSADSSVLPPEWTLKKLLYVPANLFWFQGHFPSQPILPGVAQINWVVEWTQAQKHFGENRTIAFIGFDVLKFQKPIEPNQTIELEMSWKPLNSTLSFTYHLIAHERLSTWSDERGAILSSGKVKFKVV